MAVFYGARSHPGLYGGRVHVLAAVVLTIIHTVSGCDVCEIVQVRGPRIALGDPVVYTGTQRSIRFAKKGVYVFRGTNLQSSQQMGLQTLGPDNSLTLTVRVS